MGAKGQLSEAEGARKNNGKRLSSSDGTLPLWTLDQSPLEL